MTKVEDLALEHFRSLCTGQEVILARLERIELRLSVMEQTVSNLYELAADDRDRLQAVTKRVERIERRLGLTDTSIT